MNQISKKNFSANRLTTFTMLIFSVVLSTMAAAAPVPPRGLSAARPLAVPATKFIQAAHQQNRIKSLLSGSTAESTFGPATVLDRKASLQSANWDRVPVVTEDQLEKSFKSVRETRFFTDDEGRQRRATWLYPDDGCFVRAAVAAEHIETSLGVTSAKIFAFGDLEVKTENSPSGSVGWWYHVAAIGKVIDPVSGTVRIFVYDPAIQPSKAMEVSEWLKAMNEPKAEISVCSGGAYDPSSNCDQAISGPSRVAKREGQWYLPSEWWRLEELGRDPEKELGDTPPWGPAVH